MSESSEAELLIGANTCRHQQQQVWHLLMRRNHFLYWISSMLLPNTWKHKTSEAFCMKNDEHVSNASMWNITTCRAWLPETQMNLTHNSSAAEQQVDGVTRQTGDTSQQDPVEHDSGDVMTFSDSEIFYNPRGKQCLPVTAALRTNRRKKERKILELCWRRFYDRSHQHAAYHECNINCVNIKTVFIRYISVIY